MPTPLLLEFPPGEYKARIKALTLHMHVQSLDAIILTSKDHARYFCGFQIIIWVSNLSKPGALNITSEGETTFVGPYARLSTVEVSTQVDELQPWDPKERDCMPETYPEAMRNVLTSKGINKGRIGMKIGPEMRVHLSYDDFSDLMGRMTAYEPPMIQLGNTEPLQTGMVLAIEPDFYEEGVGVFGIEQNILVTDNGYELLSPVDHDLWILDR